MAQKLVHLIEQMAMVTMQNQQQVAEVISTLAQAAQSQAQSAAMMADAAMAEKEVVYDDAGTPISVRPVQGTMQ